MSSRRDALVLAADAARLAPSVHNSQPWRFILAGETLQIHADRSRSLPVLDPSGRLLTVSCGVALGHARLVLRRYGFGVRVHLLPGSDPDHLASLEPTDHLASTAEELALAAAIPERHSQREPFLNMHVSAEIVLALEEAASREGAWLRMVETELQSALVATLLRHADWLQRTDERYRSEVRAWLRTAPATDGVPLSALPEVGLDRGNVLLREFDNDSSRVATRDHTVGTRAPDSARVAVIGTDRDSPLDWLVAGQALGRVLLRATASGLVASVLGQVVDLPETRDELRRGLGCSGPVQAVLRIGYGARLHGATPRRPLLDVLTFNP